MHSAAAIVRKLPATQGVHSGMFTALTRHWTLRLRTGSRALIMNGLRLMTFWMKWMCLMTLSRDPSVASTLKGWCSQSSSSFVVPGWRRPPANTT